MDVKAGSVFWTAQKSPWPASKRLQSDIRCDVAVLGAGLTGALAAYILTAQGFDVVLVDKRDVARGSTSASTALILYEIDTPLFKLIPMLGRKHAIRSYQLCRDAIFQIEEIVGELKDDCGFPRKQSLYLASAQSHVRDLKREYNARKSAGFEVEFFSRATLRNRFDFQAPAAILSAEA